jgi:CRP-like cAMP-binding protein
MHLDESKRILQQSDLFQDLKDAYLDIILMACEEIRYLAGQYIFHEEDPGDSIYLVAQGAVEVLLEPHREDESRLSVAVLGPNSTFGEVTLVEENGLRAASVRCKTDAQLIRITRKRLLQICKDYPDIGFHVMYRIAAELACKLRSSNVNIREYSFFSQPLTENTGASF